MSTTEAVAYDVPTAASLVGLSADELRRVIHAGALPVQRPEGTDRVLVLASDLRTWAAAREVDDEPTTVLDADLGLTVGHDDGLVILHVPSPDPEGEWHFTGPEAQRLAAALLAHAKRAEADYAAMIEADQ